MAIDEVGKHDRENWLPYAQLLVTSLLGAATVCVALVANKTSNTTLDAIENIEATSVYETVVKQYTYVKGSIPADGGWKELVLIKQCESDLESITKELERHASFFLAKQLFDKVSGEISDKVCGVVDSSNVSQREPSREKQDAYPNVIERICLNETCTRWIIP